MTFQIQATKRAILKECASTMAKKTIDDIKVSGKKVLVRCDFNVPMKDGKITNDKRIVAALPTIKKLIADGGKALSLIIHNHC